MRVCYHLQTHRLPDQVLRLVRLIKRGSPDSLVLISHDTAGGPLDPAPLVSMPGVHVFHDRGGYGDFSHVRRYLDAVDWLDARGVAYDWMVNLTGQCYPIRPIEEMEGALATTWADGFLMWRPVLPGHAADGPALCEPRDARDRYLYRHLRVGRPSARKQRWLRPLMAVNFVQPSLRVSLAFSTVGVRRRRTPFTDDFACYGGWFFCTLSADCVRYVRRFVRDNPEFVRFLRGTLGPEEIFFQTILVNSGRFRLVNDSQWYIDLTESRNNHSKTLRTGDLGDIVASGANWARKFDQTVDSRVLDLLDDHSLERTGP
ncbi:MAG: hypothetical protein ACRDN9_13870 [Streptosporangiaceae bacterium]